MKTSRFIWMAGALLAAAPVGAAPAFLEDWELDPERMADTSQVLFDRLAPDALKERYEVVTAAELSALFSTMQAVLTGENIEDLAAYQPQAKQNLARLRANPDTQGYADWLQARMDYFDMAAEVEKAIPAPARPQLPPHPAQPQLPPHPTTPQPKPPLIPHPAQPQLPPHPTTPQPQPKLIPHPEEPPPAVAAPQPAPAPSVDKARNRYVENKQVWLRKLANRPAPARAAALLPDLKRAFRAEGVPPELVWQAEAESTFNPAARSPAGAVGLYQFMPATAQQFGLSLSPVDERLDAAKNARAAAKYLKALHARFGDWPLAFAAYNCGEGRVSKILRAQNGKTFDDIHDKLPAETRMYVPKIAALVRLRENADLDAL